MYLLLQNRLVAHVRAFLKKKYNIDLANIVVEQPPKIELGEFALPVSFELARVLRKAPRKIADEIVAEMELPEGFAKFEVAGAGYINARLDRTRAAELMTGGDDEQEQEQGQLPHPSQKRARMGHPPDFLLRHRLAGVGAEEHHQS